MTCRQLQTSLHLLLTSTDISYAVVVLLQIIWFVESKMHSIAPNLSAAIGSEVAARLMGVAGGLIALSTMPSCNIQVTHRLSKAGYDYSVLRSITVHFGAWCHC